MTFDPFSEIVSEILPCHFSWMVTPVAPRIVNDVSYVTRIKHASHSVWQAQYLVRLEGDTL